MASGFSGGFFIMLRYENFWGKIVEYEILGITAKIFGIFQEKRA